MNELDTRIENALNFLQPYPYLQALVVVFLFIVIAKAADLLISRFIIRLVLRTETSLDDDLIAIMHRPVLVSVTSIGLLVATDIIGLEQSQRETVTAIIQTILVFTWFIFGLSASKLLLLGMSNSRKRFNFVQPTTAPLLKNAAAVLIFLTGVYALLVTWNINVTGLVASAGIVGLALSFAAQDTLSNLFAGMAILADRPYRISDVIIIDSGERGTVTHIGLRSTRLLTRDDVEISIPNSVMGSAKIINEAGGPPRRFRVRASVGTAYGSDIDKVMELLESIGKAHEGVMKYPEPRVRFRQFGESSLDFDLLCWINDPEKQGLIIHDLNCAIYHSFAENSIEIPFPQRDLYIKHMPADAKTS
ncbi:MAG: mechanosensitive ion channel family protein [Gammaproteobacteria bacterium]|nr:mechanosensitive ion channel family protein [Gammaproteobacteria bacterium]